MSVANRVRLLPEYVRSDTLILRRLSRALGDNILLTAVAREIRRARPTLRIVVETAYPELFRHSPHVTWAVDAHWRVLTRHHFRPAYQIGPASSRTHMVDQMYAQCPFPLVSPDRRPEIFLSDEERRDFERRYPAGAVVVCPVGKRTHAADRKEWGVENFQAVVDALPGWHWIQTGSSGPLLRGVEDLRGLPVRDTAGLLSRARLFLGLEGGLMHMARAVDCPAVVVYGGAISPAVSGYPEHVVLTRQPECAPCLTANGPLTPCPHARKCLTDITVGEVVAALTSAASRGAVLP